MNHCFLKSAPRIGVALCLLGGILAPISGSRADTPNLPTNQILLQKGLQQLDALAPGMDDDTKKHLGAMKTILEHVCLDRQHATDSELQVAAVLLRADPSRAPEDAQKKLRDTLNLMPGIASQPTFLSGARLVPGGSRIGFVDVVLNTRKKTLVEIPAGKSDVASQAAGVAKQLQTIQGKDSLWWTQVTLSSTSKGYALRVPQMPHTDFVVADAAFAREWGLSQQALGSQLLFDLRAIMDPSTGDSQEMTPEQTQQNAVDQRQAGDEAYNSHDMATAEKSYLAAIQAAPDYLVAYQRLGNLYYEQKQPAKAHEVLQKAMALKSLDTQEKDNLKRMLARSQ